MGLASNENIFLLSATRLQDVLAEIISMQPKAVIVDSIQTVYLDDVNGSAGSVSQVHFFCPAIVSACCPAIVPACCPAIVSAHCFACCLFLMFLPVVLPGVLQPVMLPLPWLRVCSLCSAVAYPVPFCPSGCPSGCPSTCLLCCSWDGPLCLPTVLPMGLPFVLAHVTVAHYADLTARLTIALAWPGLACLVYSKAGRDVWVQASHGGMDKLRCNPRYLWCR